MTQKKLIVFIVAVLILVGAMVFLRKNNAKQNPSEEKVYCTSDAKICPDGSYVSRVAPSCQFAECPVVNGGSIGIGTVAFGENFQSLGVSITPKKLIEDSRCPVDVTCIQAGTVKVQVSLISGLGSTEQVFTLNEPITTEAETITLFEVNPVANSKIKITPNDYRFRFKIEKRNGAVGEKG